MSKISFLHLGVAALLTAVLSTPAFAHKVRIFAWEEGGDIKTESKFSGGNPAKNAMVSVIDADTGKELLSGKTDQNGLFSFPRPGTGPKKLDIIINGGDGHKNHWLYPLDDISRPSLAPPQTPELPPQQPTHSDKVVAERDNDPLVPVTRDELQHLLDATIDRQLAPIRKALAENTEHGPTLQDIFGGIGYLLGLAGIAAYVQSRKNQKE